MALISAPAVRSMPGRLVFQNPALAMRPVIGADQAFCRALFHEDRWVHFAQLGLGDQMLSTMLDQQFRAQQIGYLNTYPAAAHLIIEHGGLPVGRAIIALAGNPAQSTLHLIDIVIRPAARGRGIGGDVIQAISDAARSDGATCFTLTVLQTNTRAWRLYERLGFVVTKTGSYLAMVKPLC